MTFSTTDLPQADKLDKVVQAVLAIAEGYHIDLAIANYIGFTDRQARYYRHAGELLGFVTNHNNKAQVTDLGRQLILSDETEQKNILRQAILNNRLFKAILDFIGKTENGMNRQQIERFVFEITINPSESTIARRLSTLLQWLVDPKIELLLRNGNQYVYNPIIIVDDEDTEEDDEYSRGSEEGSIYPTDEYAKELDIREEHLTVFGLFRKIVQGKIQMSPEFQRNLVWKPEQKSQFIESTILNIPLPPLYVSQDLEGNYIIVDGLQRSSTLKQFLDNEFQLQGLQAIPKLNGMYFQNLDKELQARIEDKNLLLYVLRPSVPMVVVYDIFNRINTGGTQLTRQEIRNCIFIGRATDLLKRLSESDIFRKATDNGISPKRMKDREAVLRYLAFKMFDYEKDYRNDMDEFLGKAMKKINSMTDKEEMNLTADFERTMSLTHEFFSEYNFRLPTEYSRGRINIALMESICHFFSSQNDIFLVEHKEEIIDKYYSKLLKNEEYLESIRYSTGSTAKVLKRFDIVMQILT